jgi:hypothetical protein
MCSDINKKVIINTAKYLSPRWPRTMQIRDIPLMDHRTFYKAGWDASKKIVRKDINIVI